MKRIILEFFAILFIIIVFDVKLFDWKYLFLLALYLGVYKTILDSIEASKAAKDSIDKYEKQELTNPFEEINPPRESNQGN